MTLLLTDSLADIRQMVCGLWQNAVVHYQITPGSELEKNTGKVLKAIDVLRATYAQGRTQSAVQDGWRMVPIDPTNEMAFAAFEPFITCFNEEKIKLLPHYDRNVLALKSAYKAMLSAAPPVTGGAWLPIESAPIDGTEVIVYCPSLKNGVLEAYKDYDPAEREYYWTNLSGDVLHPTLWQPLPAPPSSADKEV